MSLNNPDHRRRPCGFPSGMVLVLLFLLVLQKKDLSPPMSNTVLFDFIGTTSPEKFIAQTPEDTVLLTFAGAAEDESVTFTEVGIGTAYFSGTGVESVRFVEIGTGILPSLVSSREIHYGSTRRNIPPHIQWKPMFVLDLLLLRRQQAQLNVCMGNSITHRSTLLHIMVSTEISVSKLVLLSA